MEVDRSYTFKNLSFQSVLHNRKDFFSISYEGLYTCIVGFHVLEFVKKFNYDAFQLCLDLIWVTPSHI